MRDAPQSGPNKWLPVQLATCNTHNMQLPALPSASFNDSNEDIETGKRGSSIIFGNICDNQRTMTAHTNETEVSPAAVDDVASTLG